MQPGQPDQHYRATVNCANDNPFIRYNVKFYDMAQMLVRVDESGETGQKSGEREVRRKKGSTKSGRRGCIETSDLSARDIDFNPLRGR